MAKAEDSYCELVDKKFVTELQAIYEERLTNLQNLLEKNE